MAEDSVTTATLPAGLSKLENSRRYFFHGKEHEKAASDSMSRRQTSSQA